MNEVKLIEADGTGINRNVRDHSLGDKNFNDKHNEPHGSSRPCFTASGHTVARTPKATFPSSCMQTYKQLEPDDLASSGATKRNYAESYKTKYTHPLFRATPQYPYVVSSNHQICIQNLPLLNCNFPWLHAEDIVNPNAHRIEMENEKSPNQIPGCENERTESTVGTSNNAWECNGSKTRTEKRSTSATQLTKHYATEKGSLKPLSLWEPPSGEVSDEFIVYSPKQATILKSARQLDQIPQASKLEASQAKGQDGLQERHDIVLFTGQSDAASIRSSEEFIQQLNRGNASAEVCETKFKPEASHNQSSSTWLGVGAWVSKLIHGGKAPNEREKGEIHTVHDNANRDNYKCKLQYVREIRLPHVEPESLKIAKADDPETCSLKWQKLKDQNLGKSSLTIDAKFIPRNAGSQESANPERVAPSLYKGPWPTPISLYRRLYDPMGPVSFPIPPLDGISDARAELRLWSNPAERAISQNGSKRKVHRVHWLSSLDSNTSFPAAMKFVEDSNHRDGRSLKREIECHLYIYQRLQQLKQSESSKNSACVWPCSELFGYHLDRKYPGNCVLVTRKLSGPDFFDIIRSEHSCCFIGHAARLYEYHKLRWCILALERVAQYNTLGIRHNDIKPDNIVLDLYMEPASKGLQLDVKIIDLGTASMESAKDFTGGTSWYESPEQKMLEFHTKRCRNLEEAKKVQIGLESDAWGTGLSLAEVLIGRRVVDHLKAPEGPGPLEYLGSEMQWAVEPMVWVRYVRKALGLDKTTNFSLCAAAACFLFDQLVHPTPTCRTSIKEVIPRICAFADEAKQAIQTADLNMDFTETLKAQLNAAGIQYPT